MRKLSVEEKKLRGTYRSGRDMRHTLRLTPFKDISEVPRPSYLGEVAQETFRKTASVLVNLGILTEGDLVALAIYADAHERWLEATEVLRREGLTFDGKKHPALLVQNAAFEQMHKLSRELGLTPASRAKLQLDHIEDVTEQNPFADFPAQ